MWDYVEVHASDYFIIIVINILIMIIISDYLEYILVCVGLS